MNIKVENKVRTPKQERSIQKKERIRATSLELFCKYGYHSTTTNQIAKEAHMSIGSLYEYYANKEAILVEILDDYFESFLNHQDEITLLFKNEIHKPNKRTWLNHIINSLTSSHQASLDFNRELQYLYFSIPQVAEICNKQKNQVRTIVFNSLFEIKKELVVSDLEAATVVFTDMLDRLIDRLTLYPLDIERTRIINEGIDAICRYLFGKTF